MFLPSVTFNYIDVQKCLAQNRQPEEILSKPVGEIWMYLASFLLTDKPASWRIVTDSSRVRVPLFAYIVGRDVENLLGHGLQIGFWAAQSLSQTLSSVKVMKLHLSLGAPIESLEDHLSVGGKHIDCYRYYVGVSVQVNR